jgi:hypothetical protein
MLVYSKSGNGINISGQSYMAAAMRRLVLVILLVLAPAASAAATGRLVLVLVLVLAPAVSAVRPSVSSAPSSVEKFSK